MNDPEDGLDRGRLTSTAIGLELRHLRAFVAVAEELHFTRAARRLFLAQQALSAQIRQLEEQLGGQLFQRTTRSVELTVAGQELLRHAPQILAAVDNGWWETRRKITHEQQRMRIAYTPTVGGVTLPLVVDALHDAETEIRVTAQEVWLHEAIRGLHEGYFTVAFVRYPDEDAELDTRLVRMERGGVTLGLGHPAACKSIVTPDDLADSTLVLWPREASPGLFDAMTAAFPRNLESGKVYEYENFSRAGFVGDPVARMEIAAGRAFSVRLGPVESPAPEGFRYCALDPEIEVGLHVTHLRSRRTSAVEVVLETVESLAASHHWI